MISPQTSLAKRMGISERHLADLLAGRTRVSFARAEQLARLTGRSIKTMAISQNQTRKKETPR